MSRTNIHPSETLDESFVRRMSLICRSGDTAMTTPQTVVATARKEDKDSPRTRREWSQSPLSDTDLEPGRFDARVRLIELSGWRIRPLDTVWNTQQKPVS